MAAAGFGSLHTTTAPPFWHWHAGVFCAGHAALSVNATPAQLTLQENFAGAASLDALFAEVATSAAAPKATASGGGRMSTDCE